MKPYGILVLLSLIVAPDFCRSEHLLVSKEVPFPGHVITLVGAYQVDDEIWMTSHVDQIATIFPNTVDFIQDQVEVDLPTIVAKHVESIFLTDARQLYQHREQIGNYDFGAGDGWVNTDSAGYLFIRNYPWVYQVRHGWLWVVEGEVVVGDIWAWYYGVDRAIKKLSYYFYSPAEGWFWKAPFLEEYVSLEGTGSLNDRIYFSRD